ncbi:MAG: universal stress protein, partial [Bacteroidetes bacterium]|nr:universal stress protein [Bacteroidota bacterium]
MKKIIAAIDGLKYSESTANYATYFAKEMNAHLVGIMLDDFTYASYKIYELVGQGGVIEENQHRLEEKDKQTRAESAALFEASCQAAGINYSIHHDRSVALQELLHESIYADLLIINARETLTHYEET